MSLMWTLRFLFAFVVLKASAFPLTGAENGVSGISLAPSISHPTFSSTLSVPPPNTSTENALYIKCDGAQYGDNLNVTDCQDARVYMSSGSEQLPWVDRHTHFSPAHYALPYRFMGGKYHSFSLYPMSARFGVKTRATDGGRCYFQIDVAEGHPHAFASLDQVQAAAHAILTRCERGARLQGGTVSHLGPDGGLTMELAEYRAAVECRGTFPPRLTCSTIMDDMETARESRTFGPSDAQVPLPVVMDARDGKSAARILGRSDTTSWYRIWEAVMVVYSVCARNGRGGIVTGLGDHGHLFVTMTARDGELGGLKQTE